jgi:amidohydrolase
MSRFARVLQPLALGLAVTIATVVAPAAADEAARTAIDRQLKAVESKMIAWRRDIHQNPELGNREVRTSALVAAHLKALG